ncbi:hypothetical protein C3Y87_15745 [Carbonactinospora thermoautotrophica]|uniref:TraR/DksA family transcriptional regulator n=1 Tax=Carbonactinospora thermoautotrophica TaxID=1469144 RepID=UPI002271C620|nr:TraR/DksA C4-type zinc finger protein [Carbonactinospora thermoautotrophica]MCX9192841.1 hypothetical protein [Carbonactinospora thermoautotrophica]
MDSEKTAPGSKTTGKAANSRNAGLSREQLTMFRELLEEQRRFRLGQLRQFDPASPQQGGEAGPSGQREVDLELAASARTVLAEVEAALERIEQGTYGLCESCGEPIAPERLEIVPQARYCVTCQRARETRW